MTRIPPAQYRYKKGKSGNPAGRPKRKTINMHECLRNVLFEEHTTVDKNGKKKKLSALEIILRAQKLKAVKGDYRSTVLLLGLMEKHNMFEEMQPTLRMNSASHALIEAFKKDAAEWDVEAAEREHQPPQTDPR